MYDILHTIVHESYKQKYKNNKYESYAFLKIKENSKMHRQGIVLNCFTFGCHIQSKISVCTLGSTTVLQAFWNLYSRKIKLKKSFFAAGRLLFLRFKKDENKIKPLHS